MGINCRFYLLGTLSAVLRVKHKYWACKRGDSQGEGGCVKGFTIVEKESGRIIGTSTLQHISQLAGVDIGFRK